MELRGIGPLPVDTTVLPITPQPHKFDYQTPRAFDEAPVAGAQKITRLPSHLRFLVGKNEQIIEVQVPSTDNSKRTRSLKAHVLDPS